MSGQVSLTSVSSQIQHDTSTGDAMTSVFDGHFNIIGHDESARAKMVCRRVVQSNRVLLLASVLMDPSSVDRNSTGGLYLRTRLWQVLHPPQVHETSQEKASVHQIFHKASLELYDVEADTVADVHVHVKAGSLTNFVLRSLNAHMTSRADKWKVSCLIASRDSSSKATSFQAFNQN